jgi:structural maintenance of chromosome 4
MFELAARLVGVYKVNHMTKSVTIENQDYIMGRVQSSQNNGYGHREMYGAHTVNQTTMLVGPGR